MTTCETLYTILPSEDSTLALEVSKTGLMKARKHALIFERFKGELRFAPDQLEVSCLKITIDAQSLICRDKWLKPKKQQAIAQYAKNEALVVDCFPEIKFTSTRISHKALRGFLVEGTLQICDVTKAVKVNIVLNPSKKTRLQIDGDANLKMSDFGIKPPSSFLPFARTEDQALVRILLWATPPAL